MAKLFYRDVSGTTGSVELGSVPVVIGRATDCQIQTQDAQVSRRHARVIFDGASYWIEDTGSANGVYVNNERVPRHQLRHGMTFRCGHLEARFESDSPAVPVPAASPAAPVPVPPPPPVVAPVPPPPPVVAPAPPPVAAVPQPAQAPAVSASELASLRSEVESERRKRTDLEFEVSELKRKLDEAQARPAATGEGDAEKLRRRVEQLESELKRKGGGGGSPAGGGGGASVEALKAAEAERDRLKNRVAELESKAKEPTKNDDQEMELIRLRRKVEQLEADLRRVRGGKPAEPAPAPSGDALVAELEEKVRRLITERDEAIQKASASVPVAQAAAPPTDPKVAEELERAKRRIDQLESELRRKPVGQVADNQRATEQRTELESALRQLRDVEKERDSLRELVAKSTGSGRPSKATLDGIQTVSDGLADIRAALRAAGDDVALEQLEQLRSTLRQVCSALGLST